MRYWRRYLSTVINHTNGNNGESRPLFDVVFRCGLWTVVTIGISSKVIQVTQVKDDSIRGLNEGDWVLGSRLHNLPKNGHLFVIVDPFEPNERKVRRVVAAENGWVRFKDMFAQMQPGTCWMTSDKYSVSPDGIEQSYEVNHGLIESKVMTILWPPHRISKPISHVDKPTKEDREENEEIKLKSKEKSVSRERVNGNEKVSGSEKEVKDLEDDDECEEEKEVKEEDEAKEDKDE